MNDVPTPSLDLAGIDPAALADPQALLQIAERLLADTQQQMAIAAGAIAWSKLPEARKHGHDREQYIADTAQAFLKAMDDEDRASIRQHIIERLQAHQRNPRN